MKRLCLVVLALGAATQAARPDDALDRLNTVARTASCLIEANRVIKLSAQVQGTLSDVSVRRGDKVKTGQIVARLDSQVEEAQVDALRLKADTDVYIKAKRAVVEATRAGQFRQRELGRLNIASAAQVQKADTEYTVALAELAQAELDQKLAKIELRRAEGTLNRRILRSPVNGVVMQVALDPGEFADPQQMAVEIAENETLRVELYLPLAVYPLVKLGMQAQIAPMEPIGGNYPARIISRDGHIDSASGLFQTQFELPNPGGNLPGGIRCSVRFEHP